MRVEDIHIESNNDPFTGSVIDGVEAIFPSRYLFFDRYDNPNIVFESLAPFPPDPDVTYNDQILGIEVPVDPATGFVDIRTREAISQLINGEIDAYFTGGTYTASPARYDGATNVRGITPRSGPVDGKGGVVWIELTSLVNNPDPSDLAQEFLEFVQQPEISKAVAFTEGTYNPVSQMGDEAVMSLFDEEELDAIQMDTLAEEMERSLDYQVVASYDTLIDIYTEERRS